MLEAERPQPSEKTRWFIPLVIAALACLAEGDAAFGDEPRTTALKPHKGDASFYDKSAGDNTASGETRKCGKRHDGLLTRWPGSARCAMLRGRPGRSEPDLRL